MIVSADFDMVNSFVSFITIFILFLGVLVLTYFVTRWAGNYQKSSSSCKNIEVIETVRIAPGKYVQIIRVGKKYIAVAVGKDTVTMLSEVEKEELTGTEADSNVGLNFKELFEKVREKQKDE